MLQSNLRIKNRMKQFLVKSVAFKNQISYIIGCRWEIQQIKPT